MLTIIDDYSRRVFPNFLKHKYDAFDAFKAWKVMVEKQTEWKVKVLHTDNGMEFCSHEFNFSVEKWHSQAPHHSVYPTAEYCCRKDDRDHYLKGTLYAVQC
jgi:transposase InsO family protein